MAGRLTRASIEAIVSPTSQKARLSRASIEAVVAPTSQKARLSRVSIEVIVNASATPPNPPSTDAGIDQSITLPATATLDGTVTGGETTPTTTWSKLSGPGSVTFGDASAIDTTATFSLAGTYVLQLLADDGTFTDSDTVTITVADAVSSSSSNSRQRAYIMRAINRRARRRGRR